MRILKFIANHQTLKADPRCNFKNIVPGTEHYLVAKFSFGDGWNNCKVAASFWCLGKEYPVLLEANGQCVIPKEALTWSNFKVSLTGINGDYKITTNKVLVLQEG